MVTQNPVQRRRGGARYSPGGAATRVVLSVLGSAGMIGAVFLDWTRGLTAVHLSWRAFLHGDFGSTTSLVQSVGGVFLLIGAVALFAVTVPVGWLTRQMGVLGVLGVVLFSIQVHHSKDHSTQLGMWTALAGSVLCLVAAPVRRAAGSDE